MRYDVFIFFKGAQLLNTCFASKKKQRCLLPFRSVRLFTLQENAEKYSMYVKRKFPITRTFFMKEIEQKNLCGQFSVVLQRVQEVRKKFSVNGARQE